MQALWHSIKRALVIVLGVAIFGWGQASQAKSTDEQSSCLATFGGIWEDEKPIADLIEINGNTITSLADFKEKLSRQDGSTRIVEGGDFSGWDFSGSGFEDSLTATCFRGSKLVRSNFAGTTATGIGFIKSDLSAANFIAASMSGVLFRNANLTNVIANGANFSGGHFDGGWFDSAVEGWNLNGADMSGFVFECGITVTDGCPVYFGNKRISARKADFTGASLHGFGLVDSDMDQAIMDETVIGPAQLPFLDKARFRGDLILRGGDSDVPISPTEVRTLIAAHLEPQQDKANASFDCTKAETAIEQEICGEYRVELRKLDREISKLYRRSKDSGMRTASEQRAWIGKRNRCVSEEYPAQCLTESYEALKSELLAELGEQNWLKPGEEAVFLDEQLKLSKDMRGTELYGKIIPVLAGASMANVYVRRNTDGSIEAKGESVGANAHTCTLGAKGIRFDRNTGWYSVTQEQDGKTLSLPVFRYFDGRVEIYRNGKPEYGDETDALIDYVSCGARASFGEMIRMDVPEKQMEAYRQGPEIY